MSDEEFRDWWALLNKHLQPNTPIRHWSAAKGYLAGSFEASPGPYSSHACIRVEGPKRTHIYQRLIFGSDFRAVLRCWNDYRDGVISRRSMDALSTHSTYVLSIIRWLEEKAGSV